MKRIRSASGRALSAATALAIVMAGLAAGAPRASSAITSYTYVNMGDSLSSGEGTYNYIYPTNTPGTNMCHRSVQSYSAQYVQMSADTWDLDNVACSGAGTFQIAIASNPNAGGNPDPDPSQDTDLSASTRLVTISIGINDLGLLNLATQCYSMVGKDDSAENSCFLQIPTNSDYLKALNSLSSNLDSAFFDIRNQAKNATVAVLTYPQIFPSAYSGPCQNFGLGNINALVTSPGMLTVAQELVSKLDNTIANEVKGRSNFILVDESNALAGHDVCQTGSNRWVNQLNNVQLSGTADPESLHPTARGYQAMATVLAARLDPGYFSDLSQDTAIFNAYKNDGGLGAFGWPYDNGGGTYVHYWSAPGDNVQDFSGNGDGHLVTFVDGPHGAFFVANPFWTDYVSSNYASTCLSPTDNAYSYNGGTRQDFVNCFMTWTSSAGVVVHGPNPVTCTNYGGSTMTGPNACIGFKTAPPPGQPASGNVWFSGGGVGFYGQEIWTYANGTVATSTAIYTLSGLNTAKASQLQAYIPNNDSDASHAHYHFCTPSGGCVDRDLNQNNYTNQWATFGTVCSADGTATITLADDGGDNYPAIVGADAIRAVATTGISCSG